MVESMTGFGRGQAQANGFSVETEIRSVNNRYCDVSIKLPGDFQHMESELRSELQRAFSRGKITVTVKLEQIGIRETGVKIDEELAAGYYAMLDRIRIQTGMDQKPQLRDLMQFSDIFIRESFSEEQQLLISGKITESVRQAAENTLEMRRSEGKTLASDLLERIDAIETITKDILGLSANRLTEARLRLQERVRTLLDDDSYDKERLELEITLMADKLDITEEIVRLNSHLAFFRENLKAGESAGRKLNFLMQEMLREINTVGSKAYNADIAHRVVEAKEIIEIIREQIQNLV